MFVGAVVEVFALATRTSARAFLRAACISCTCCSMLAIPLSTLTPSVASTCRCVAVSAKCCCTARIMHACVASYLPPQQRIAFLHLLPHVPRQGVKGLGEGHDASVHQMRKTAAFPASSPVSRPSAGLTTADVETTTRWSHKRVLA